MNVLFLLDNLFKRQTQINNKKNNCNYKRKKNTHTFF